MASQRFGYDPYDYYCTAAPYNYAYYPYYERQPVRTRRAKGFFAGDEPAAPKPAPRARDTKTSFSIPVHGPDLDPETEPKVERERKAASARARVEPVVPAMSVEEAVVRMQATARGFLARKAVRAVREVQQEAEQVAMSELEALVADPRARVVIGEALMRMLLRLDTVRGARDYRRRVTKWVLALQDAVDTLETKLSPVGEEAEIDAPEATSLEMAEESAVAQELPDAVQHGSEMESIKTAVDLPTQVKVDEAIAAGEPEVDAGEEVEKDANVDVDEPEDSDAEGEWEMVSEEENEHSTPVVATSDDQELPHKEPASLLETTTTASVGAADGVDVTKVMEMVAALCEQSTQQFVVIGALAERVDALEQTVRRMEDAVSRRRRSKKLSTEGN